MFGKERSRYLLGQLVEVCGNAVGHLDVFGIWLASGIIDAMQLGGVGREVVDLTLLFIEGLEESLRFVVPTEAIPHHQV
jgi:hypothetical protein